MNMNISFDTIASILGLMLGGGSIGTLLTWRYQRNKAKAEAKQAEAEAEKTKYEAMQANAQLIKDIQGSYQQLASDLKANLDTQQEYNEEQKQYIAELKEDRQHLRKERDEMRDRQDKLEEQVRALQRDVARNGRQIECMRPFLCGRDGCAIRVPVTISQDGIVESQQYDIQPHNDKRC
ncbi:MAG: hypothetical protein IIW40_01965 [Clostridia bacterium]|nr:hypothetical protein [Clostridia bacterium]